MTITHFQTAIAPAADLVPNIEARTYTALAVQPATAVLIVEFANTGVMSKSPAAGGQPSADEWIFGNPVPTVALANWSIRVRTISGGPPTTGPVNTWINFATTPTPQWSLSRSVFGVTTWQFQVDVSSQQNGAANFYTSPTLTGNAEVELP